MEKYFILLYKKLLIYIWWKFIIKENEFHYSLDRFFTKDPNELILKREIAHLLDYYKDFKKIPEKYILNFKFEYLILKKDKL